MKSKIQIINILMLLASVLTIPAHSFAQSSPVTETGCQEGISRAIVNVSAAYLRLEPDYESPLETQELMGMVVTVLERQRYWVKVETDQPYTAWVNEKALHFVDEQQLADYIAEDKYVTVASWTKVMDAPRKGSAVCDLVWGDELRLGHEKPKAGCLHVLLPDGREGWVPSSCLMRKDEWIKSCEGMDTETKRMAVVSWALDMLCTPYLWGGMSTKGFDCSGLVRLAYMSVGIKLPRNASAQYAASHDVPCCQGEGACAGEPHWDLSALKPGDLLFFGSLRDDGSPRITHVGIYIGGGKMVHASQVVRVNSIVQGEQDCYENMHRWLRTGRLLE